MFTCSHGVNISTECADCNVIWDARFAGPPPAKSGLVISKPVKPPAASDYLYAWEKMKGEQAYKLNIPPASRLQLWNPKYDGAVWKMHAELGGKKYTGERDTLEEAFRAVCGLLHKYHKDIFWRIDTHVVVDNWRGELPCTN